VRLFAVPLFVVAVALAPCASAQTAADSVAYEAMLERVKKGDLDVDFRTLRYAYAASAGERSDRGAVNDLVGAMFRAYKAKDFDGAIETAQRILATNYLDIDAHVICDLSYRMLSNTISAEPYHEMASRLLRSIYESGDGTTPETAYEVIAVREEYSFLNAMGLTPLGQTLMMRDGRSFDAIEAANNATGETRTVFFTLHRASPPRR